MGAWGAMACGFAVQVGGRYIVAPSGLFVLSVALAVIGGRQRPRRVSRQGDCLFALKVGYPA